MNISYTGRCQSFRFVRFALNKYILLYLPTQVRFPIGEERVVGQISLPSANKPH